MRPHAPQVSMIQFVKLKWSLIKTSLKRAFFFFFLQTVYLEASGLLIFILVFNCHEINTSAIPLLKV